MGSVLSARRFEPGCKLAIIPDFCDGAAFHRIRSAILEGTPAQRVHIPGHKRGETIAYTQMRNLYPAIAQFYQGVDLSLEVSRITGHPVAPTPEHDQSSCSLLIYTRPGDRIGWHYDHNFYNGFHCTALLSVMNEGRSENGLSSARLLVERDGAEWHVPTPANTLVVFEGASVRHCVTPQGRGERRIVLSMTFCSNSSTTWFKDAQRRFKDIAYIGLRALWT